jgi:hypothetical protein
MPIYEWDIEQMDGEEIADHNISATLKGFGTSALSEIDGKSYVLCLVRDHELDFKGWAYVRKENGRYTLPPIFSDAQGKPVCAVPKKFQQELDRVLNAATAQ